MTHYEYVAYTLLNTYAFSSSITKPKKRIYRISDLLYAIIIKMTQSRCKQRNYAINKAHNLSEYGRNCLYY